MATIIDGRYEVTRGLGRGAMGSVYLANDPKIGREVAIKILQEKFAKTKRYQERFEREARAIAALRHPNIVEIYDYGGSPDEHLYLVMEYIRGPHLGRLLIDNGPFPDTVLAACGLELCSALVEAHANGVIHRDLKPDNVFLDKDRIVLADFGIVKAITADNPFGAAAAHPKTDVVGTPGFMAPEQLEERPLDARTDLYAFGALLYYLATGKVPHESESPYALLKKMKDGPPPPLLKARPELSVKLAALIHDCLKFAPEERPPSAEVVRGELRRVLASQGIIDARDVLGIYSQDPKGYRPPANTKPVPLEVIAKPKRRLPRRARAALGAGLGALAIVSVFLGTYVYRHGLHAQRELTLQGALISEDETVITVNGPMNMKVSVNGTTLGETPSLFATVKAGPTRFEFSHDNDLRLAHIMDLPAGGRVVLDVDWARRTVSVSTEDAATSR